MRFNYRNKKMYKMILFIDYYLEIFMLIIESQ